ncbi:MAG: hypothetical protein H0U85_02930 [Gemmatimonadales bacterium]|nr:hypothetical protein [Gemmatimonadales bacterium]
MYRIELAPGEEALFKSIDEMAAGIANGVISSRARIWHQTSEKWLPIEFHPHYKIALTKGPQSPVRSEYRESAAVAGPAAVAPAPIFEKSPPRAERAGAVIPDLATLRPLFDAPVPSPYERPATPQPIFGRQVRSSAQVQTQTADDTVMQIVPAATIPLVEPVADLMPAPAEFIEVRAPRGRIWTIGLIAAGAVVLLGGGAAISAFRAARPAPVKPVVTAPTSYGAQPVVPNAPAAVVRNDVPKSDSIALQAKPAEEKHKITDAPVIAEAPKFSMGAIGIADSDRPASDRPTGVSASILVARYSAAYEAARADADKGLRFAGLGNLLSAARLGAGDVGSARSTVAGVTNVVRIYRKRAAAVEQAYRDSMSLLSRQNSWTPSQVAVWENRPTQIESPDMAAVANGLLDAIDGALDVLAAHEGGYEISGGTITFRDAQAARDYGAYRRRLASLIDSGADSGTPAGRLLKALGGSRLPDERTGS